MEKKRTEDGSLLSKVVSGSTGYQGDKEMSAEETADMTRAARDSNMTGPTEIIVEKA